MKMLISSAIAASMVISTLGAVDINYDKYTSKTFVFDSKKEIQVVDIAGIAANIIPDLSVQPEMWTLSTVEAGSRVPVASFNIISSTASLDEYVNVKVTLANEAGLRVAKELGQYLQVVNSDIVRIDDEITQYSTNVYLPAGLSEGTYYIGLEVDTRHQIDELNEFNNRAYIAVEVGRNNAQLGRSYRTVSYTDPASNKNSSCRETYGDYARMATWDDVEYYAQSHSIANLIENQEIQSDEYFFVSDDNDHVKAVRRGSKFTYFSALDHVEKHQLELHDVNYNMGYFSETLCWIPSVVTGNDEWAISAAIVNRD